MAVSVKILIILSFFQFLRNLNRASGDETDKIKSDVSLDEWCSLTCGITKLPHIACTMKNKCSDPNPCTFLPFDKEELINSHNLYRNKFAGGDDTVSTSHLTAANMVVIKWDEDLAYTAACNLVKCATFEPDKCHITPRFAKHAGQNTFFVGGGNNSNCALKVKAAVPTWYNEIKYLNSDRLLADALSFRSNSYSTNCTQLIWAETTHVGCVLSYSKDKNTCSLVCNYGPGGNIFGDQMFRRGQPCSKCPKNYKCSKRYSALCERNGRASGSVKNLDHKIKLILVNLLINKYLVSVN